MVLCFLIKGCLELGKSFRGFWQAEEHKAYSTYMIHVQAKTKRLTEGKKRKKSEFSHGQIDI